MSTDVDVIIVGAGAAGIAAAIELQKLSLSFIVLEARNRIGGRAFTDRETFRSTPVDLGASWIHLYGPKNPIYPFYQQFKADEQQTNSNDDDEEEEHLLSLDYDGKYLPTESEQQAKAVCAHIFSRLEKFASTNQKEEDQSIEVVMKPEYDRLVVESQGQMKRIVDSFLAEFEAYEASDFVDLSAKQWVTIDESTIREKWVSFGYGTILERIVDQQRLPIQLNTLVKQIDTRNSDRIVVSTSADDSPIFCRYVLVTIPLGCLKQETIVFEPPLPEWKREAISLMGFGLMNKLILQFSECFWHSSTRIILRACQEQRAHFLYTVCLPPPANILILLVSGTHARKLETLTDKEILEHVMQFLRQIFPQSFISDPVKYKFTRWSQDPFAFGSYSNYAVHSDEHTIELLAKETADGRVHWAGEHTDMNDGTSEWISGCVHSAFRSGQRAAQVIQSQLCCSSLSVIE